MGRLSALTTSTFCRNFTQRLADEPKTYLCLQSHQHPRRSVAVFHYGSRTHARILLHFCMLACVCENVRLPAAPPAAPPPEAALPHRAAPALITPRRFQSAVLHAQQFVRQSTDVCASSHRLAAAAVRQLAPQPPRRPATLQVHDRSAAGASKPPPSRSPDFGALTAGACTIAPAKSCLSRCRLFFCSLGAIKGVIR